VPDVAIYIDSAKLQKDLKAVGPEMVAELKEGNKALGEIVSERARELVPVKSGALLKTIRAAKAAGGSKVSAGTPSFTSKVNYAAPIHFGWAARNIEPQPFLYDALDDRRDEVVAAYEKQTAALLKKAGLK